MNHREILIEYIKNIPEFRGSFDYMVMVWANTPTARFPRIPPEVKLTKEEISKLKKLNI